MNLMLNFIFVLLLSLILVPALGILLNGVDRILTAKIQFRMGPPLLQPLYDVVKLFSKQSLGVNKVYSDFVLSSVVFSIASVFMLFFGQNLLIVMFAMIVSNVFIVLAGYSANSPYSLIGAERELLQLMSTEPIILLSAVGIYMVTGSFDINEIIKSGTVPFLYLPGVFFALLYALTVKLRKSPFDLSTSHHGHQELVKGLTTEFVGSSLAWFEIIHWYETVFFLSLMFLFFVGLPWLGVFAVVILYFLEILVDNVTARVKWELMLKSVWIATLIFGVGNLLLLYLFN